MKSIFRKSFLLSITLLTACEVGPDYERPSVETPATYKEVARWSPAQPKDEIDRGAWWSIYKDPILDDLEKQVDVSNQNLKAAEAAYRQANAIVDEARASLFPTLTLNAAATRSKQPGTNPQNLAGAAANATWVPDIWGGIRRSIESDEANAEASAGELASARLSAQGMLATTYFELRVQDEMKRLLNATVEADKKSLSIVKNQYALGVAAQSDVLLAVTQLETTEAAAVNADVNRLQYEHAIAVLVGKPPAEFILPPTKFAYRIPRTPVGVPSTLLERRPDIATAERQMAAENAQIGVETSAFYPDLTLSASYGYEAAALSKLLQASNSVWSLGPSLAETVFDAGAREARVEQARALYDESVASYRQTVLNAFQGVEDDLGSLKVLARQAVIETSAVKDARQSEQITLNQYKEGLVSYINVLTAQTTRLTTEETALSVYESRLVYSVALIQALGGGWDTSQLKPASD